MSKLIAVWGSPGAGKTVLATQIATALATGGSNTILLSADDITPALPVLCPGDDSKCSVGAVLEATDIIPEFVLNNCVTIKNVENLALLCFANGENDASYIQNTAERSNDLLLHLSHMADYVIVDASSDIRRNKLTDAALGQAEVVFQIYTAEPRSQIYFAAQRARLDNEKYNYSLFTRLLRLTNKVELPAINEALSAIGNSQATIPYSPMIVQQYAAGRLFSSCSDKKFSGVIKKLIKEHIYEEN